MIYCLTLPATSKTEPPLLEKWCTNQCYRFVVQCEANVKTNANNNGRQKKYATINISTKNE